jgi:hypothetical protein
MLTNYKSSGIKKTLLATLISFCLLVLPVALSSCGISSPPPSSTSSIAPSTSALTTASATYGSFSNTGQSIFTRSCSLCHGDKGQGGNAVAVIGPNIALNKYASAEGLFNKISSTMPRNSPGSLSHEEFLQVPHISYSRIIM